MASSTTPTGATSTGNPHAGTAAEPKRGFRQILKSYFYWTYPRGSFHYDVLVTLILLFIFVSPRVWDFGAKPISVPVSTQPLEVVPNGRGVIITVQASDVSVAQGASYREVKLALRKAIEPVTGDDVFIEHWETATNAQGNLVWKVWAHK
jgi:hypothetical protein